MGKYKFKKGESVAHVSNLKLRMYIERIIFKSVPDLEEKESSPDEKPEYDVNTKRVIDGIEVSFKDSEGKVIKEKFFSHNIIPWHIASQGEALAKEWRDDNIKT